MYTAPSSDIERILKSTIWCLMRRQVTWCRQQWYINVCDCGCFFTYLGMQNMCLVALFYSWIRYDRIQEFNMYWKAECGQYHT